MKERFDKKMRGYPHITARKRQRMEPEQSSPESGSAPATGAWAEDHQAHSLSNIFGSKETLGSDSVGTENGR